MNGIELTAVNWWPSFVALLLLLGWQFTGSLNLFHSYVFPVWAIQMLWEKNWPWCKLSWLKLSGHTFARILTLVVDASLSHLLSAKVVLHMRWLSWVVWRSYSSAVWLGLLLQTCLYISMFRWYSFRSISAALKSIAGRAAPIHLSVCPRCSSIWNCGYADRSSHGKDTRRS